MTWKHTFSYVMDLQVNYLGNIATKNDPFSSQVLVKSRWLRALLEWFWPCDISEFEISYPNPDKGVDSGEPPCWWLNHLRSPGIAVSTGCWRERFDATSRDVAHLECHFDNPLVLEWHFDNFPINYTTWELRKGFGRICASANAVRTFNFQLTLFFKWI